MTTKGFLIAIIIFASSVVNAQVDYNRQYVNAKALFREGKYNLAMESFKPLIPYDKANPYAAYASFYYALSAYNQGFKAVAKDAFNQLKASHAKWNKMDEVNFWLAKIHFDNKDYFQGLKTLAAIDDKKMKKELETLKESSLSAIKDVETLKMMHEEYPKDEQVVQILAAALALNTQDPANHALLESLIKQHNLKRNEFIPETPKTVLKEIYTVAVMLPFMVNSLDASAAKKKNQIVLDFYEGMQVALDTLTKQGIKLSLRAYDTQRSVTKINSLLQSDELKSADLLVGPFFQEENKPIQDFSLKNKINVFNPFSNNTDLTKGNPYAYLFQPSTETIGRKSGEFLSQQQRKKSCMVYYGTSRRDSLMAANFTTSAKEKGLRIIKSQRVTRDNVPKIMETLATPTEYDEFKYPIQFTLKKDSVGSIFIATDDPLIYSKVLAGVETRGDSILVVGLEEWLNQPTLDPQKYQILPLVLAAPNFSPATNAHYRAFLKKFIRTQGRVPSLYAKMGYEFLMFAGHTLKKHGVYFQDGLNKEGFANGYIMQGHNFQMSKDNQWVPFVRFKEGEGRWMSKP